MILMKGIRVEHKGVRGFKKQALEWQKGHTTSFFRCREDYVECME
jgi:hypothetical protein